VPASALNQSVDVWWDAPATQIFLAGVRIARCFQTKFFRIDIDIKETEGDRNVSIAIYGSRP
jgi:hypothetical protein